MEDVIVGARGSRLAQVMVQELITHIGACPVVRFRARSVMTGGDRDRKTPVRNLGGEGGVFTTQLEQELLAGRVDIAVQGAPRGGLIPLTIGLWPLRLAADATPVRGPPSMR